MTPKSTAILTTALISLSSPSLAQSKGDFLVGIGIGQVDNTDSFSDTAAGPLRVRSDLTATFTGEYFISDNIGIELLASLPFEHNIELSGAGNVASTNQLPPTLSVQYYFRNKSVFTPFVGVGVNYTIFFDDEGTGPLEGADVDLENSLGIALHAGVDIAISERGSLRADIRWIDIDTDATVNGVEVGNVSLDPVVFGASYIHRF